MREVAEVHAEVNTAMHGDAVQRDIAARILIGIHMVEAEEGAALQHYLLEASCTHADGHTVNIKHGKLFLPMCIILLWDTEAVLLHISLKQSSCAYELTSSTWPDKVAIHGVYKHALQYAHIGTGPATE